MNFRRRLETRLQWRLIVLFLPLAVLPVIFITFYFSRSAQDILRNQVGDAEVAGAQNEAASVNNLLQTALGDAVYLAQEPDITEMSDALIAGDTEIYAELTTNIEHVMLAFSQSRRIYSKLRFIDKDGNELVRVDFDGQNFTVSPTDQLQNKADHPYYQKTVALDEDEVYVSPLDLDRDGTPPTIVGSLDDESVIPVIRYGAPVFTTDPKTGDRVIGGMVVTSLFADVVMDTLVPSASDENVYLVNQDGYYLKNTRDPKRVFGFEDGIADVGGSANANVSQDFESDTIEHFRTESAAEGLETAGDVVLYHQKIVPPGAPNEDYWVFIITREPSALFSSVNRLTNAALLAAALLAVVVGGVVSFTARQVTQPISALSKTVDSLARGNLSVRVEEPTQRNDEIGRLGQDINRMADQLEDIVILLESRVSARTRDLQAIVDVNRQISTVLDVDRLMQDVVDLTKERFRLYHAHIYSLDETGTKLNLASGAGHTGRQMVSEKRSILLTEAKSIVAQAARQRQAVVVEDVRQSPVFLPHPLLPETRSEVAIPLQARGQLLGVLDLQSDKPDYFVHQETVTILQTLSDLIATALSNATLYEEAERTSRHEQALGTITQRLQAATDVDEVLQVAVRELGKALRVPQTAIELKMASNGEPSENEDANEPLA